jgi:hypothetical protein
MTSKWHGERGEGRLGTMIGVIVLLTMIYLGVKFIPIVINVYTFRDFLEEEARYSSASRSEDEERARIVRKARELELPVPGKAIHYTRGSNQVEIKVKYTVPIQTPVYTYDWVCDESVTLPVF